MGWLKALRRKKLPNTYKVKFNIIIGNEPSMEFELNVQGFTRRDAIKVANEKVRVEAVKAFKLK